jgi:tetraacyldisaccharide 4'-kinase
LLLSSHFREIVSGRRSGPVAALARAALRAAEVPYCAAVRWRNRRYDSGASAVHRLDVPVLSVGNITLGGTGKTPMVEWLARWFAARGVAVGLVSRGYAGRAKQPNDEARELAAKLPDVPHVQDADRVAAARWLLDEHRCQVVLLDDAFQHRRIARQLDIVLLDALEPFGYGHVFPRGTLREPPEGLGRADVLVLTRADAISADQRAEIRRQAQRYAPQAVWVEAKHAPRALVAPHQPERPLSHLASQPLVAFCGIGNPAGFRHTLTTCGYHVAEFREFPDHHAYSRADVSALTAAAERLGAAALVCTEKDLVKLAADHLGSYPLWAVRIGMEIQAGLAELEDKLKAIRL